jgi:predicted short-subunit dehydrogenase-like oxidoreductase (DUF2520 family)
LHDAGCTIASVVSKSGGSALGLAKAVQCRRASTSVGDVAADTEVVVISTPDREVEGVARLLSQHKRLKFRKIVVVHTSGVLPVSVLTPLKKKGALVASMHPVQSFPAVTRARGGPKLKGVFFGIEADEKAGARIGQLVRAMGGQPMPVSEDIKPLYHATCVFASGYMVTFLNAVSELAHMLDLKASWTEVFGPIMTTSMENTIRHSANEALTGPIVRHDMATISLHLDALRQWSPQLIPLYTVCGLESARIARDNGRIGREDFQSILALFRKAIRSSPSTKKQKVKR